MFYPRLKVLLYQLDPEVLDMLSEALFDLQSLEDLRHWLEHKLVI